MCIIKSSNEDNKSKNSSWPTPVLKVQGARRRLGDFFSAIERVERDLLLKNTRDTIHSHPKFIRDVICIKKACQGGGSRAYNLTVGQFTT